MKQRFPAEVPHLWYQVSGDLGGQAASSVEGKNVEETQIGDVIGHEMDPGPRHQLSIELDCAASNTGSVAWSIWYYTLDTGALVVAA